ncbi:hypothetical protein Tco_1392866 [Tanacetum coccineum]
MRTRRSNYPNNSNVTIPKRRRKQVSNIVEPEIRTIVASMAERTMEELLRAPMEGYGHPWKGSTAQIPPPVIPISIPEPDVPTTLPKTTPILDSDIPKSLPKPNITYPSRRDDQKSRDKQSKSKGEDLTKSSRILRFDINTVNENATAMRPKGFPKSLRSQASFLSMNFKGMDVKPRLGDPYQTTRYSSTNDKSVNRIDIIDAVCEEYAPELLGFSNSLGGNPTPTSELFISEFILEEIEAYLKDDSISPEIDHADCNPEEDICLIEKIVK